MDKLTKIDDFDLSPVTARIEREGYSNAAELEGEFRKFAKLWVLEPNQMAVPSEMVDPYWHAFVLDTPRYREFCNTVFGTFIDHNPNVTKEVVQSPYQLTLEAYARHFGQPPAHIWGAAGESCWNATCGNAACGNR